MRRSLNATAALALPVSIMTLAITIAVGIWRIGIIYGTVSNEHQEIFRQLHQLADRKCP